MKDRVAQLTASRKQLLQQMPDLSTVLPGSLLSRMVRCNKPGCRFCEKGKGKGLDPRADRRPIEFAAAATQGRDGYAGQFQRKDRPAQIRQAAFDVLELGRVAPMIFGGEVEDLLGVGVADFHRHYLAGTELAGGATALVLGEHPGVLVLELERQAGTHHAMGVGRVDNGLDIGGENIAGEEFDHNFTLFSTEKASGSSAASLPWPLGGQPRLGFGELVGARLRCSSCHGCCACLSPER
jgi:hypothetical protein